MKLTKKTIDTNTTEYYKNGVLKYEHYKDSDGYESWAEYDKNGNIMRWINNC